MDLNSVFLKASSDNNGIMDFTMNVMDNGRSISVPVSQTMGGSITAYHPTTQQNTHQNTHQGSNSHQSSNANNHHQTAHLISVGSNHQQTHQLIVASNQHQEQHHQQHDHIMHDDESALLHDTKPQGITKHEIESVAFTPPPRVTSVSPIISHSEMRVEKSTIMNDLEPFIKVEIRGPVPGITTGDKDKNSILQLHFNSVNEVLHYFSQRAVPQADAFSLISPEFVRNINPDLMRNHFLYVPNTQEGIRVSTNGLPVNFNTATHTSNSATVQPSAPSPVVVATGGSATSSAATVIPVSNVIPAALPTPLKVRVKKERRRGEVPPGTIINKTPPMETNPNQFCCWICGVNLMKSLPFEEHMVEQHSVEKPYRCEDCGVSFKQKAHIDRHRRIHLPTRPYQCGICGKGFTRNEHVRRHAFTHSGEKPFHCPFDTCSKSFARQQQLTKHILTHTKISRDERSPPQTSHPQQPCHPHSSSTGMTTLFLQTTDDSGRVVTINQDVANSMLQQATTTPIIVQQSNHTVNTATPDRTPTTPVRGRQVNGEPVARPYQCGVCGKAFIRNEHLRRHMLIHSGEKPHVCGMCGKAFPRREHLTKHLRSHSKDGIVTQIQQSQSSVVMQHQQQNNSGNGSSNNSVNVSNITQQVTLPAHAVNSGGNAVSLINSAHQLAAHGVVPTSHSSAHLSAAHNYLPMLGLLAEVV